MMLLRIPGVVERVEGSRELTQEPKVEMSGGFKPASYDKHGYGKIV